jgi:hypothetical protein
MGSISAADVFLTMGAVVLGLGLLKLIRPFNLAYASTRIAGAFEDLPVMNVDKCIELGATHDCCWAATNGQDTIVSYEAFTHCKGCNHPDCIDKDVDSGFHPII